MKYVEDEFGEYQLESGRRIAGECGDHGLKSLTFDSLPWHWDAFTPEERREIADYMIKLWEEWGNENQN